MWHQNKKWRYRMDFVDPFLDYFLGPLNHINFVFFWHWLWLTASTKICIIPHYSIGLGLCGRGYAFLFLLWNLPKFHPRAMQTVIEINNILFFILFIVKTAYCTACVKRCLLMVVPEVHWTTHLWCNQGKQAVTIVTIAWHKLGASV